MEDYGLRIALQKTFKYLIQFVYQEVDFIIYEIDLVKAYGKEIINKDFVFKLIDANDHAAIRQIEEMEEWLKGQLKAKLESNAICMVILDQNKLAGFNLATRGEGFIKLLKLNIVTESNEAWSEHIAVHKDYRGMKLANDLRNRFYTELGKHGIKALYGHRQEFNVASRGSARKYTVKEIGTATYKKILVSENLFFDQTPSPGKTKIVFNRKSGDGKCLFTTHINQLKG